MLSNQDQNGSPQSVVRLIDRHTSRIVAETSGISAASNAPSPFDAEMAELTQTPRNKRLELCRSTSPTVGNSPASTLRSIATPVPGSVNEDISPEVTLRKFPSRKTLSRASCSRYDSDGGASTSDRAVEQFEGWHPTFSHSLRWESTEDLQAKYGPTGLPSTGVLPLHSLYKRHVDRFSAMRSRRIDDRVNGASVSYGTLHRDSSSTATTTLTAFRYLPFVEKPRSATTLIGSSTTLSPRGTPSFTNEPPKQVASGFPGITVMPPPATATSTSQSPELNDTRVYRRYPCPKYAVLLIHGLLGSTVADFHTTGPDASLIETFLSTGAVVYSCDYAGHGLSRKTAPTKPFSFVQAIDDIKAYAVEIAKELPLLASECTPSGPLKTTGTGTPPLFILGRGLGAYLAIQLYMSHASEIRCLKGLVLSSMPYVDNASSGKPKGNKPLKRLMKKTKGSMCFCLPKSKKRVMDYAPPVNEQRVPAFGEGYSSRELSRLASQLKKCRSELNSLRSFLPTVQIPVLILHGLADPVCPPSEAESLYQDLSNARPSVLLFQNLDHNVFRHGPESKPVFREVHRWLEVVLSGELSHTSLLERQRVITEPVRDDSVPYLPDGMLIGGASMEELDPEEKAFSTPLAQRHQRFRNRRPTPVSFHAALAASMFRFHQTQGVSGTSAVARVLGPYG